MDSNIQLTIGGATKRSTLGQHPVTVDWNGLPDISQDFIRRYGLKQYLADATAGASDSDDAKAKIAARVAKLVSGDLSRTRGEGSDKPDSIETRAMKLARTAVRNAAKAKNVTLTKEQVADAAKRLVDGQPKWKTEAKKQLDAEAKSAETLVDEDMADILADLLTPDETDEDDDSDEDAADK